MQSYQLGEKPKLYHSKYYISCPKHLLGTDWYVAMRHALTELCVEPVALISPFDVYYTHQAWLDIFPRLLDYVDALILVPDKDGMIGQGCEDEMKLANKAGKVRYAVFMQENYEEGLRCVHDASSFELKPTGSRFKRVAYVWHDDSRALGTRQPWQDLKTPQAEEMPPVEVAATLPTKPRIQDLFHRYKGPGRPPNRR